MAEAKEKFEGTIEEVTKEKGKGGWRKYTIKFEGVAKAKKVDIPPDDPDKYPDDLGDDYEPQEGDEITIWPGTYGSFRLDKKDLPRAKKKSSSKKEEKESSSKGSSSGSSHSGGGSSQYRHPDTIELQDYYKITAELFAAMLPAMKEPPSDIEEMVEVAKACFEASVEMFDSRRD